MLVTTCCSKGCTLLCIELVTAAADIPILVHWVHVRHEAVETKSNEQFSGIVNDLMLVENIVALFESDVTPIAL